MVLAGIVGHTPTAGAQQDVANRDAADTERGTSVLLSRRVTLQLNAVTRQQAMVLLSAHTHVPVQYHSTIFEAYPERVTLSLTDVSLGVALERVLDGTSLRVVPDGKDHLSIVEARSTNRTDSLLTGTIAGRVIDSATGRGLPGATVKVGGTKIAGIAGDSGRFVLRNVPTGSQLLTAKLFGYRMSERHVDVAHDATPVVRVMLVATPNILSGVVTTAIGSQDRRTIGQDITTINVDSVMRVAPIRTVTDLLDTRVPGLTVTRSSGIPGASSRIRIRGVTGGLVPGATNATNDPIVIVDGMRVYGRSSTQRDQNTAAAGATAPSPVDQIDPNSIEKIEVFKGPSASAQFGADAANGVIVITTKRGRAGPVQLLATLDAGIEYLPGTYAGPGFYNFGHSFISPDIGAGLCGISTTPGAGTGAADSFSCTTDSLVVFQALDAPRLSMFNTGTQTGGSLAASGGFSAFSYALTGAATGVVGNLKMPALYQDQYAQAYKQPVPTWMKHLLDYSTWSGTGSFTSVLRPTVRLDFTTSLFNSDQRQSSGQGQLSWIANHYVDTTALDLETVGRYAQKITAHTFTASNALRVSWSRWAWLPLNAEVGFSNLDRQDQSYVPFGIVSSLNVGSVASSGGLYGFQLPKNLDESAEVTDSGSYKYGRPTTQTRSLNVAGQLFPSRMIATSVGFTLSHQSDQDFYGETRRLSRGITTPTTFTSGRQTTSSLNTGGWFVEPRLNLGQRFFAAPGFRLDNQSGLHGGLTSLLPKLDFTWVAIDRQGEAPLLGAVTLLRPRIAFGTSGVQPDPAWLIRTYQVGDSSIVYPGVRLFTIGNPILRPEHVRELEYGGEIQLWENRLTLNTSGHYTLRYDAIQSVPLGPSAGGVSRLQYRNIGRVRGTGVEITADAIPVQTAGTSWTIHGSLSTSHEILVARDATLPVTDMGNGIRLVPGYPLNGRWVRPIMGYPPRLRAGQRISVSDIVVGDSVQYAGSATPGYALPLSSTLAVFGGNLRFNLEFNYEHGVTQFASGSAQRLTNLYLDPNATVGQQAAALTAYCDGIVNSGGLLLTPATQACSSIATLYGVVQTTNILRWKTFSVDYSVPRYLSQRLHVPRMTVALQASNLGLWTNYRGKDPDVNGTPVGEALTDSGQDPLPRTWGIHVTLGN